MKGFSVYLPAGKLLKISMLTDDFWAYLVIRDSNGEIVNFYQYFDGDNAFAEYYVTSPGMYYIDATIDGGYRITGAFTLMLEAYDFCQVTYDANNGFGAPEPEFSLPGQPITISPYKPYRAGYIFMGWSLSQTATTAQYQPYYSFTAHTSVTLFAVWRAYTPVSLPFSTSDSINTDDGLSWHSTRMKGYSFYAPAGSAIVATMDSADVNSYLYLLDSNWNVVAYNDDYYYDDDWTRNSKLAYIVETSGTYYLQATTYSLETGNFDLNIYFGTVYTITYDAQGGSPTPPSQTMLSGEPAFIDSPIPIKLGNTFLGWNTDPTGNETYYQRYSMYTAAANTQLYAIWAPHEYSINEISAPSSFYGQITTSDPILEAVRDTKYNAYSVSLTSGQEATIYMESFDFDSYLYLLGPNRDFITRDDDSGGNFSALITFIVPATGTYYILASQYDRGYGSYTLSITESTPQNSDQAAPPEFILVYVSVSGTTYNVTIPATDGAEYSFDGINWSSANIKTGCRPGETVTGYKRMAAKTGFNASATVSNSITLPPFSTPGTGGDKNNNSVINTTQSETIEPDIATPLSKGWSNPYDDVAAADWFYEAVRFVSENSLMNGTGTTIFSPGVTMSRAMLVTVLYRLEGSPAVSGAIPFPDVKSGQWYSDAILWASRNNIVNGYDNGTFGLNDPVTREQVVVILHRYAKANGLDIGASVDLSNFSDKDSISTWALDATKWAVSTGLIEGRTGNRIAPGDSSTRAEVATILKRYIEGLQ